MPTKPSDAARLARVFLARPDDHQHIYPLTKLSGLRMLRVVRVLDRMMEVGWIADGWETVPNWEDRPPRRHYVLTERGRQEMPSLLVRSEA